MSAVTIEAPASKSLSHRGLVAAALARGTSRLSGVLECLDTQRTMDCLAACGAAFRRCGKGGYDVTGMAKGPEGDPLTGATARDLDVGESGTTCRLLAGVVAAGSGRFRLHGEGRMDERPLAEPARALSPLGVRFRFEGKEGFPPLVIETTGLPGGKIAVRLDESSQYLSGILLAAPLARGPVVIGIAGDRAVSRPYVSLTLQAMADFGAPAAVEVRGDDGAFRPVNAAAAAAAAPERLRFRVTPCGYRPRALHIEGDWTNASYFLAAGAVGRRPVTVTGLRADSLQGDRAVLDLLGRMGAQIFRDAAGITVAPAPLHGIAADLSACPDLVPTLAVAACFAHGRTTITNVGHLRLKESDRLAALAAELGKTGCRVAASADGLVIDPAPLPAGRTVRFATRGDHRLVMAPALFALAGITPEFDDPGCVAKSFPDFHERFAAVLEAAE